MAISVPCACGKTIRVNDDLAGQVVECIKCRRRVIIPAPRSPSAPAPMDTPDAPVPPASASSHLYWLLLLALAPLFISPLMSTEQDIEKRLVNAILSNPKWRPTAERVMAEPKWTVDDIFEELELTEEEFFSQLPGQRLDDKALLARNSQNHWYYAAASIVFFYALIYLLFGPSDDRRENLIWVGIVTGTAGIMLLLAAQYAAFATRDKIIIGVGPIAILFWIAKFIGWSYELALHPNEDFGRSLIGFTFGVGLCEEFVKVLPLILYYGRGGALTWRGACLWGLASGTGFGISEGIHYSANMYNGITSWDAYAIRFASCVALHAIWAGSVGITLSNRFRFLQKERQAPVTVVQAHQKTYEKLLPWFVDYALPLLGVMSIAMALHGLYDTFLKKDMEVLALLTALVSFCWLAWQIESHRDKERELALEHAPAAAPTPA